MSRVIKLVSFNDKYKDKTFYAQVPWNPNKGIFETGQEKLSPAELKKEPFIIDPEEQLPIVHGAKLEIRDEGSNEKKTRNDVLYAAYLCIPEIAHSKEGYNGNQHLFYIEDKKLEAVKKVSKFELTSDAVTKFRENISSEKIKKVAIFLDIKVDDNIPEDVIKQAVYDVCTEKPETVLRYFKDDEVVGLEMFIKNLIHKKILNKDRKGITIASNNMFIADNLEGAVKYCLKDKNQDQIKVWQDRLVSE